MSLCLVTSSNSWLELIVCRYRILFSLTVSIYCSDRHFLEQQKLKWNPTSPNLSRLALGCGPPSGLSQISTEPLGQPQVKVKLLELFWVCNLERTCPKWPRIHVWFECTTFKTKNSNWLPLRDLRLFHLSSCLLLQISAGAWSASQGFQGIHTAFPAFSKLPKPEVRTLVSYFRYALAG